MKKINRPLFFLVECEEHYYYILGRSMPSNQDRLFMWITKYELQDRINRLKQFAKSKVVMLYFYVRQIDMEVNTKEVNKAIEISKTFCSEQQACQDCPYHKAYYGCRFSKSCGDTPENWKLIKNEVN